MMNVKNFVQSLLKQDVLDLFVMKCTCHLLAYVTSKSSQKLPDNLQNMLKSYSQSSKQLIKFEEF